uniref:SFRICE_027668 n=1 Tax=Spodoptera frugiperda TaxID=7108 RepID=A0A2H1VGH3_SPOFR
MIDFNGAPNRPRRRPQHGRSAMRRRNNIILDQVTSDATTYISIDTVMSSEDCTSYPVEFLNSLELSGVPSHKLQLKVGIPICVTWTPRDYRQQKYIICENFTFLTITVYEIHPGDRQTDDGGLKIHFGSVFFMDGLTFGIMADSDVNCKEVSEDQFQEQDSDITYPMPQGQFAEGVAKNNKKKKIQLDESVKDQAVHVIQSRQKPAD